MTLDLLVGLIHSTVNFQTSKWPACPDNVIENEDLHRLFPVRTEPLVEGNKSSFLVSGHVPYSPTNTAVASAASVFWIRRDLLRIQCSRAREPNS